MTEERTLDVHQPSVTGRVTPRSPEVWRLVWHSAASGAINMATDEAIGQAVAQGFAPPTLRLYAWDPPCVSLGRNQKLSSIDQDRCARLGYEVVRRPTGGRAILHTDELTYSVVARPDHPIMAGLVLESYLRLSHGLVAGLAALGIEAQEAPGTNRAGPDVSAACFEVPSAYEIVAGGRKILGSAQSRRSTFVLQHGSLPLFGDLGRVVDCLAFESEGEREALRASLRGHAATVEGITGRRVGLCEAGQALASGFALALHLELVPGELSAGEVALRDQLLRDRYASPDWTASR